MPEFLAGIEDKPESTVTCSNIISWSARPKCFGAALCPELPWGSMSSCKLIPVWSLTGEQFRALPRFALDVESDHLPEGKRSGEGVGSWLN